MLHALSFKENEFEEILCDQTKYLKLEQFYFKNNDYIENILIIINNKDQIKKLIEDFSKIKYKYTDKSILIEQFLKLKNKIPLSTFKDTKYCLSDIHTIDIKKIKQTIYLKTLECEDLLEIFQKTTLFSKKITICDPNLPSLFFDFESYKKKIEYNIKKSIYKEITLEKSFKSKSYKISLKEILHKIYLSNYFKDELNISIYCTIKDPIEQKFRNFYYPFKKRSEDSKENYTVIKNYINSVENEYQNLRKNVENFIKETLKDVPFKKLSIEIKEYKIKDSDKNVNVLYNRYLYAEETDTMIEVRMGFDLLEDIKELKKNNQFWIKLISPDHEKKMNNLEYKSFPDYKSKDLAKNYKYKDLAKNYKSKDLAKY